MGIIGRILGGLLDRKCSVCECVGDHQKVETERGRQWKPVRHQAPCGAVCAGGPVGPGDLLREVHGIPGEKCPRCKFFAPSKRQGHG